MLYLSLQFKFVRGCPCPSSEGYMNERSHDIKLHSRSRVEDHLITLTYDKISRRIRRQTSCTIAFFFIFIPMGELILVR